MGLFVSTVSTSVSIPELGIVITHPTTDFNVGAQFDSKLVEDATALTTAIQAGTLIWRKTAGGAIETPASYDPDWLRIDELNTGTPIQIPTSQIPDFSTTFDTLFNAKFESKRVLSNVTNNSNATFVQLSDLSFALLANSFYLLEVFLVYQTPATGTGIAISISAPAGNIQGYGTATQNAADGTDQLFQGNITSSGDVVTSTGTPVANSPFLAKMEVLLRPTANGNVVPQFRSEANNSTITILAGSMARITKL